MAYFAGKANGDPTRFSGPYSYRAERSKYRGVKTLRELRGLRASLSFSGFLRAHLSQGFPLFSRKEKTRTEVTEFTEGLTPLELAARLPS